MSHLLSTSAFRQVGSVLAETDADGELAATHHADAWGNRLEDWDTGVWGGVRVGWAHNTKEIDGLTDLTYMYQRWYAPETGTFLSRAPYPPMMEHEYGFAAENPVSFVDPDGAFPFLPLPFEFDNLPDWQDFLPDWLKPCPPEESAGPTLMEELQVLLEGVGSNVFNSVSDLADIGADFVTDTAQDANQAIAMKSELEKAGANSVAAGSVTYFAGAAAQGGNLGVAGAVASGITMAAAAGGEIAGAASIRANIALKRYRRWAVSNGVHPIFIPWVTPVDYWN